MAERWGVVLVIGRRGLGRLLRDPVAEAPGALFRTSTGWARPSDLPRVTRAAPLDLGLALRWGGELDTDGWDRARRVFVELDPLAGRHVPGAWDFDPDDRTLLGVAEGLRYNGLATRIEVFERGPRAG